jgi:hypothetical protein
MCKKISIEKHLWIIFVLALIISLVAIYLWLSRSTLVRIRNESQRTVKIIDIYCHSGSTGSITINAGKSFDVKVNFSSEWEDLIIRYVDRHGVEVFKPLPIDVSFFLSKRELGIGITMDSNDTVTYEAIDLSTGLRWH